MAFYPPFYFDCAFFRREFIFFNFASPSIDDAFNGKMINHNVYRRERLSVIRRGWILEENEAPAACKSDDRNLYTFVYSSHLNSRIFHAMRRRRGQGRREKRLQAGINLKYWNGTKKIRRFGSLFFRLG